MATLPAPYGIVGDQAAADSGLGIEDSLVTSCPPRVTSRPPRAEAESVPSVVGWVSSEYDRTMPNDCPLPFGARLLDETHCPLPLGARRSTAPRLVSKSSVARARVAV